MSFIKLMPVAAIAAFALYPVCSVASDMKAQYVGGSVESIPANTWGALNLDDAKEMSFQYGDSTYRIPYSQVNGSEVSRVVESRRLWHVPVPSMLRGGKEEMLTINVKADGDGSKTLNFQLASRYASSAEARLRQRKRELNAATNTPNGAEEQWWGDQYWKTPRNQKTWGSEKPITPGQLEKQDLH